MNLLNEDNVCGQTLLSLISSGNAIITELLRLSDHIPNAFDYKLKNTNTYQSILFDFDYLKKPEEYDEKIDSKVDLIDLDEEFRDNHFTILERFYQLYTSIYRYITDYIQFLETLTAGDFVQHTVNNVLLDFDGKQLMTEAIHLYGVMLLLLEMRIPGWTRERMIVAYFRYVGSDVISDFNGVCKLCRSTGYINGVTTSKNMPKNYPENFFNRFKIDQDIIEMIIGRLRSDDIYNHTSAYPNPKHRSVALADQAGMLYVILYFKADYLHHNNAIMREIVDKHFNDNWVTAFYMGYTIDLSVKWASYKATYSALKNILATDNITYQLDYHSQNIIQCNQDLDKLLTDGVLLDEYVLDHINSLINTVTFM